MNFIKNIVNGFVMGCAELIPGVSGSTIALIMGFYTKFIDFLYDVSETVKLVIGFVLRKNSFQEIIERIKSIEYGFVIPLIIGTLLAIAGLSNVILFMLDEYPHYLYAVLAGLVISVIPVAYKEVSDWNYKNILLSVVVGVALFTMLSISKESGVNTGQPNLVKAFFSGFISVSGMILPGVSGSFILLILGIYHYIVNTISAVIDLNVDMEDVITLSVFAAGVGTGFITIVQLIKKAIFRYKNQFMAAILGLLLGSLRALWPFVHSKDLNDEIEIEYVSYALFSNVEVGIILVTVVTISLLLGYFNYKYVELQEEEIE